MKRAALKFMQGCGAFALARTMSAGLARILMYHNFSSPGNTSAGAVTVNALREQLTYLRDHFHIVPLACIPQRLKEGRPFDNFTVALTVDDGRRNFYEFLFPLLREFAMPATFFVTSSFIRGEDWVWTDKVLWLSDQPSAPHELSPGKIENLFGLLNRMRPEIRNAHIETIASRMGVTLPHEAPREYAPCTWTELHEMADSGLVEIGSHSATHPILSSITDEEAWRELTVSRSQIEEGLGKQISAFCFPNGKPGDYRPSQVRQIMDAGYSCAVVASSGLVVSRDNPYELPRIGVSGYTDALSFCKSLDGAEYYQARVQRTLRLRDAQV